MANLPFAAEMPGLLYPKRKPVGNVKLDKDHYLYPNLLFYFLPGHSDKNYGNYMHGLKTNAGATVLTKEGVSAEAGAQVFIPAIPVPGRKFTVYTKSICTTTIGSGARLMSTYGDSSQFDRIATSVTPYLVSGGMVLNFTSYAASFPTTQHNAVNKVVDIIYEFVSHTEKNLYVWIDNVYKGTVTDTVDSFASDSGLNQLDAVAPVANSNFHTLCSLMTDNIIADKQAIIDDPYQFLIPE